MVTVNDERCALPTQGCHASTCSKKKWRTNASNNAFIFSLRSDDEGAEGESCRVIVSCHTWGTQHTWCVMWRVIYRFHLYRQFDYISSTICPRQNTSSECKHWYWWDIAVLWIEGDVVHRSDLPLVVHRWIHLLQRRSILGLPRVIH